MITSMASNTPIKGQTSAVIGQIVTTSGQSLESGATFALHALQNAGQSQTAQFQSSGGPVTGPQTSGVQPSTGQHSTGAAPLITPVVTNPTLITGGQQVTIPVMSSQSSKQSAVSVATRLPQISNVLTNNVVIHDQKPPTSSVNQSPISAHNTTPLSMQTSAVTQNPINVTTLTTQSQHIQGSNPSIAAGNTQSLSIRTTSQTTINLTNLTPAQQQQQQQQQQQFQRLKVEDALSYLDQVKFKFNNQPQVYNDFLDIMKEFKSQSIDTPGVIQRVSTLFKGHPELIVGFNTFLPPGYKIEMHANDQVNVSMPNAPNTIIMSGTPLTAQPALVGVPQQVSVILPKVTQTSSFNSSQAHQAAINVALTAAANQSRSGTHHEMPAQIPQQSNLSAVTAATNSSTVANGAASSASGGNAAQPVEFNHAINYVNKIKNRFQGQPEIYKQFLEILHTYQKEQRSLKEGTAIHGQKMLTETEVFTQVAKLFQNQEDLLQEFSQFLPDANGSNVSASGSASLSLAGQMPVTFGHPLAHHVESIAAHTASTDHSAIVKKPTVGRPLVNTQPFQPRIQLKRSQQESGGHHSSLKRQKMTSLRDVSLAEAGKYGSLNEFAFFDKVRKALRSQEVYENFLRCLVLYNHEILSRTELVHLVTPFLGKFPELLKWFKDFLGYKEGASASVSSAINTSAVNSNHSIQLEGLSHRVASIRERERERMSSEMGMEIDYSSCKRYGASYRALPRNYVKPECTGRTPLCREVLNDTWVSFPSWSEDSTFVSSRKTQYEEYIYRCEDERYELDVVLETNLATIRVLEAVQKKISRMTVEDRNRFKLDDSLGGTSNVIHQKAIRRIYGDKAQEIIEGLKKNPAVAVPLVIRRLMMKEEEWREAQKQFNKIWREQNEKYYLKSLDHQGISFKQNDIKFLRSKSLLNEIETIFEERHEQNEANPDANTIPQPHMTFVYKDKTMIEEACHLIIHHVKRQTSIHKEDKQKVKQLLRQFIPDLFATPRGELSDDEMEDDTDERDKPITSSYNTNTSKISDICSQSENKTEKEEKKISNLDNSSDCLTSATNGSQRPLHPMLNSDPDDDYAMFFVNNNWYLFFRLHHILCERLGKMYERSVILAKEEAKERLDRKQSTALALRLKPNNEIEVEHYFPAFVDFIKQVLDGNLDTNQYEDMLREMFGIHAYIAFTMDKVVQNIVRQLQHIVCDEACNQCTDLYIEEIKNGATGGPCATAQSRIQAEAGYQKRAEQLLSDENCFKLILYKKEGKLCVEMVDTDTDESGDELEQIEKWSDYVERYTREIGNISEDLKQQLSEKPLFMRRNIRSFKSRTKNEREDLFDKDIKCDKKDEKSKEEEETEEGSKDNKTEDKPNPDISGDQSLDKALTNTEVIESTECKFDVSKFKLVFVVQSESVMYRKNSIKRAKMSHKKVSQNLFNRFNEWHKKWLDINTSSEQQMKTQEWLVSSDTSLMPTMTGEIKTPLVSTDKTIGVKSVSTIKPINDKKLIKLVVNNEERPPYRKFCRYKMEFQ